MALDSANTLRHRARWSALERLEGILRRCRAVRVRLQCQLRSTWSCVRTRAAWLSAQNFPHTQRIGTASARAGDREEKRAQEVAALKDALCILGECMPGVAEPVSAKARSFFFAISSFLVFGPC